MPNPVSISRRVLVFACVLSASIASVSAALLLFFHPWIFPALGIPMPLDERAFVVESSMSLALALVLLGCVRAGGRGGALLGAAILGKALDGGATYAFCVMGRVPSSYLGGAILDLALVLLFLLYWIQSRGDDLYELGLDLFDGLAIPERAGGTRALVVGAEETGAVLDRLVEGLEARGYAVDRADAAPRLAPKAQRDWDLVVIAAESRLFGPTPRVVAMLHHPQNRAFFRGRDVALVVVSAGAHRRALATMLRLVEALGANVVTARAFAPKDAAHAEVLGRDLADRARTRPHWTLLLASPPPAEAPASTRRPKEEPRSEDLSA